jgi:hypothetical protein
MYIKKMEVNKMEPDIQKRIDELNGKLQDSNLRPQDKQRIARELISLGIKKMLSKKVDHDGHEI